MQKLSDWLLSFYKRYEKNSFRKFILFTWIVLLSLSALGISRLSVDFQFESFFPRKNADISFFKQHKEKFGYDNDYLLVVVQFKDTVFKKENLKKLEQLDSLLTTNQWIESVKSITNEVKYIKGPLSVFSTPLISSERKGLSLEKINTIKNHELYNHYLNDSLNSTLVYINHDHFKDIENEQNFVTSVKQTINSSGITTYDLVGKSIAQNEFISYIRNDFILFISLSVFLSVLVLWGLLKNIRMILIPVLVSTSTLLLTLGLMGISGFKVTILAVLLPAVILFVSTSDSIHLINSYKRSFQSHSPGSSLLYAVRKVFTPTLLTSVTTAIGFLSLLLMPIDPIKELGLFAAASVLIAFIITYTLGPALLPITPDKTNHKTPKFSSRFAIYLIRYRYYILFSMAALLIVSILIVPSLHYDAYLLKDLPEESKTRTSFEYADKEFGGSKPYELAIWTASDSVSLVDKKVILEINTLEKYLHQQYGMARIISPVTLIKYRNQTFSGGDLEQYNLADLDQLYRSSLMNSVRFNRNLLTEDNQYGRITGFIPEWGSATSFRKNEALRQFIEDSINPNLLNVQITGTTYLIDKSNKDISELLLKGLAIAIICTAIILSIYFRSLKMLIIAIIPNLFPLLVTAAIMALASIPLKLTTAILFVIAFGIAVDDTIHMIGYWKQTKAKSNLWRLIESMKVTGVSILHTTLIIVVGFSIFTFSSFATTFYLGLFISIALLVAVIIDLTLLPLLLLLFYNKK